MTTLTIIPNWKNKTAKFKGTIAAGEHVAVSIANDDGYITDTTNLRLRVVHPANGKTLAQFPMPETADDAADDESEVLPSSEAPAEGEVDWASDMTPIFCILNLNTDRMLMAVPPAANVPLLFVLDDYEGKTLYFKDYCEVTHWPRRVGEEEPVNLDDYKDIIADFREDIYGEDGFKDRVENAEAAAVAAAARATAAEASASGANTGAWAAANAAAASSATALQAQSAAETAKSDAIDAKAAAVAAQGAAEDAQRAAETAQGKAEEAQSVAETAASAVANEAARATAAESALDTAIKAEKTRAEGAESGLASDLAGAFKAVAYNSTTKKIVFTKQDGTTANIDAADFIKDGMVSSVVISGGNLVVTFNSDAGQQPISIPLTQIFNPSNYYDKSAADDRFVQIEPGKVLSTNDYTTEEKEKLAGIESGAKNNVLEYANLASFPVTGEANKIYVAKDTNYTYRWETNAYVQIGGGGGGGSIDIDASVTPTSANAVKSSGIWSALWGALQSLPVGFSSLYDWCVSQLAKKVPTSRMINGKGLSYNITLDASDVGAVSEEDLDKRVSVGLPFDLPEEFFPIEAYINGHTGGFTIIIENPSDFIIIESDQCYYLQIYDKDTSHSYPDSDRTIKVAAFDKDTLEFDPYHGDEATITFNGLNPFSGDSVYIVRKVDSDDAIPAVFSMQVASKKEVNGKAPLASPAFTGTPTAPTPEATDNSTKVATTAFVKTAISGISVTPLSGRNFDFATTQGVMDALKATIEALGGTVTNAPTASAQNNQIQGE